MNVTVIPADKFIQVDGVGFEPVEFEYDEGVHAIQWDGVNGHIEFVTSDGGVMTTPVSQMEVQPYVDAWQAEKARLETEAAEPTPEETNAQRIAEIQDLLIANDLASVRSLRAKLAGTATVEDDARLTELEEQAQALRAELATSTAQS
ncbi:hypothetical protein [Halodesulfovibrio aestuarii]|uniref:hypothetical protein n=1 Tax=Halodesulfovibrio aestuarii TaxID=126333 RepID=UPI003D33163F